MPINLNNNIQKSSISFISKNSKTLVASETSDGQCWTCGDPYRQLYIWIEPTLHGSIHCYSKQWVKRNIFTKKIEDKEET